MIEMFLFEPLTSCKIKKKKEKRIKSLSIFFICFITYDLFRNIFLNLIYQNTTVTKIILLKFLMFICK